jgi:hypothetical protein
MLSYLRTIPEIVLIGTIIQHQSTTAKRIPTMCFLVRHPRGAFLQQRFVVAVLNDVFGIQCSAENLLNSNPSISSSLQVEYEKLFGDKSMNVENLRPASFEKHSRFFINDGEVDYILGALKMNM